MHILLPRGQSLKVPKEEVGVGPKGGQRPLPCPSDQEQGIWLVITSSPPCLRHWTPRWLLEEPGLLLPSDLHPNSDLGHHIQRPLVSKRVEGFHSMCRSWEGHSQRRGGVWLDGYWGLEGKGMQMREETLCLARPHHSGHLLPNSCHEAMGLSLLADSRPGSEATSLGQLPAWLGPRSGVALSSACASDTSPRTRQKAELAPCCRKSVTP